MKSLYSARVALAGFLVLTAGLQAKVLPPPARGTVRLGVDRLLTDYPGSLRGRRVGLLTHKAGVTSTGRRTVDALLDRGVDVRALFAPEHGLYSAVEGGKDVANTTYGRTRIPVYSLYGDTRRPRPSMLRGLDVILVDLQDVGARIYTYISTVCYLLDEARKCGVEVWVLDRPNPLGGERVEGATLDRHKLGFTGIYPMPMLHGMTIGEMAKLFNEEFGFHAKLRVVPMAGWRRSMLYGDTGLPWIAPSPNLPTWQSTLLYPGLESIACEGFLAEGRGTRLPFQLVGAPWVTDPARLARALSNERVRGVRFVPYQFRPVSGELKGRRCSGVKIVVEDPGRVDPMVLPLKILRILRIMYPRAPGWSDEARSWAISFGLPGGASSLLDAGAVQRVVQSWQAGSRSFESVRRKYLIREYAG